MYSVTIIGNQEKGMAEVPSGTLLSDVLHRKGISFSMPCGGIHTCGKCKMLTEGSLDEVSAEEMTLLSEKERAEGIRLACCAHVLGDCTVKLLTSAAGSVLTKTKKIMPSEPGEPGYGGAVDIGTTTVVVYLYRLSDGEVLSVRSALNRQSAFGADVISRIRSSDEGHLKDLQTSIKEQLDSMIGEACIEAGISGEGIRRIVVAGNTTMLHLLMGLDPHSIAVVPFTPVSLFGETRPSGFFKAAPSAEIILPGCVSSYVGADITCAALAAGLMGEDIALLIDLGTNGEMVLKDHEKVLCCSTAAGPAFEGAGMQMGMTAADGAVSRVREEDGEIFYEVIGGGAPAGICGSGIIDAVSVFLKLGLIDETGRIDPDVPAYERYGTLFDGFPALKVGDSGILITQEDIRKLQLAKAAVAAGARTLLHHAGRQAEEVEKLYLAGGFGNYVDLDSAAAIGLFPEALREKAEPIGNGAGTGASMLLLDGKSRGEAQLFLSKAVEVSLSADPVFMDQYVEQMMF